VFSPPKRIIRLKNELAKELATGIDAVFGDDSEIDENEMKDNVAIDQDDK